MKGNNKKKKKKKKITFIYSTISVFPSYSNNPSVSRQLKKGSEFEWLESSNICEEYREDRTLIVSWMA
jgi:hypothetical protein